MGPVIEMIEKSLRSYMWNTSLVGTCFTCIQYCVICLKCKSRVTPNRPGTLLLPRIWVYLDLCMNFGQFQPPISSCTLNCKTTQIWWLAKMEHKHSKLWWLCDYVVAFDVVIWCFYPDKCTSIIIFAQVASPNILKCPIFSKQVQLEFPSYNPIFVQVNTLFYDFMS